MAKITLVHDEYGDWVGVYVDGKLVYENHSIGDTMLLEEIGVDFTHFDVSGIWLEAQLGLPENLEEIPENAKVRY